MEDESLITDANRVACIVAPLISGHDVESIGDDVDDLAFALVAPLGSHDRKIFLLFHGRRHRSNPHGIISLRFEIVAAVRFDFFEILGHKWKDLTLREVLSMNLAGILAVVFAEERTPNQDHATGATPRALAFSLIQQRVIVLRIDCRTYESTELALESRLDEKQFFDR